MKSLNKESVITNVLTVDTKPKQNKSSVFHAPFYLVFSTDPSIHSTMLEVSHLFQE